MAVDRFLVVANIYEGPAILPAPIGARKSLKVDLKVAVASFILPESLE
jgi:hypothetical protein